MIQTDIRSSLKSANEVEITVTGRTSGQSFSYPVWFVMEGEKLYLLPVRGSDTQWYKNLRKTPTIRLGARGKSFTANARLFTDDAHVREVAEKFRHKYGDLEAYYPRIDVAVEIPLA